MLRVEEALDMCLSVQLATGEELCALSDARGRWLARPIIATRDNPPADMSAMDGVAVRAADLLPDDTVDDDCCADVTCTPADTRSLRVLEVIAAGKMPTRVVEPGTASWVMTGGVVPEGADSVVMREYVEKDGDTIRVPTSIRPGQHIRKQAEEFTAGTPLLAPGRRLDAGSLMLAASQGLGSVWVARKPVVAILATGDELKGPGETCTPAEIYGSNSTALAALVEQCGATAIHTGVARDTLESTRASLQRALDAKPDLILSTGGVSVGDFDVVREALASEGADMRFWKVRMKPGKPLAFGVLGGVPAVGLPGNPVSCQVGFWQFVRPLLMKAVGNPGPFLPVVQATLTRGVRKKAGRAQFVLVSLELHPTTGEWKATPAASSSSGLVSAMARTDGFALLGETATSATEGDTVSVQVLADGLPGSPSPLYPWSGRP